MTAIQKGLVTTFSVCFCSGGLSFGRKSLEETLPCEHGEGGKDPGEQRAPRSSCAGQGPRGAGGELCLWRSCCGATALPPAPPARVWSSRCQRTGDVAGPVPRQGARLAAPSSPGGCLAPPALPCDAGRARPGLEPQAETGGCRSPRPTATRQRPARGLPGGALLMPPSPSCPWLSPARSGGAAADPGPTAPGWLPTTSGGFPRVEESKRFRSTSTFS